MCLVAFGFLYMVSALAPGGGGSSRYLPQAWRYRAQTAREVWRSIRCRVPEISMPPPCQLGGTARRVFGP